MAYEPRTLSVVSSGHLPEDSRELLHAGNSVVQADIYRVRVGENTFLIKTFEARPAWIRLLVGRLVLRHELGILRQLEGVRGVPVPYGMANPDCLCMEMVDQARTLGDDQDLPPENRCPPLCFFQELKELLTKIHMAGIVHGDIRRRNILRDQANRPYIINLSTAVSRAGGRVPCSRLLYRFLRPVDRFNVLKLQAECHPGTLVFSEEEILHKPPRYLTIARFLRKKVYRRWVKQRTWRKRFHKLREKLLPPNMQPDSMNKQNNKP